MVSVHHVVHSAMQKNKQEWVLELIKLDKKHWKRCVRHVMVLEWGRMVNQMDVPLVVELVKSVKSVFTYIFNPNS
jgi:hypothetical protein